MNYQDKNYGGVAMKKILKFLLFICLVAITLTACGGAETTSTGTAAAASGRVPDTNQTTSYTSIFGEDHDYTINPPSYTDNSDGTITDNVTGLMWQKCSNGQSGTNCATGTASTYTWYQAVGMADATSNRDGVINVCGDLTLAGQTGWRLPSRIELIGIVDYGVYNPSINTTYFPSTISSNHWSSTAGASSASGAWGVDFGHGDTYYGYYKSYSYYVRCVRGIETPASLTDNGNGTVTDSGTLLTWQQGESSTMTWEAALSYCEGHTEAAQTDWRLPNVKELSSIVDETRYNPAINTALFPIAISSYYWSSTTYGGNLAWYVNFDHGYMYTNDKTLTDYARARCVRGGQ